MQYARHVVALQLCVGVEEYSLRATALFAYAVLPVRHTCARMRARHISPMSLLPRVAAPFGLPNRSTQSGVSDGRSRLQIAVRHGAKASS